VSFYISSFLVFISATRLHCNLEKEMNSKRKNTFGTFYVCHVHISAIQESIILNTVYGI